MNNILKKKSLEKYNFILNFLLRCLGIILSLVLAIVENSGFVLESDIITIIIFLIVIISTFSGGAVEGVVSLSILLLCFEKNYNNITLAVMSSNIISNLVVIVIISQTKKSFTKDCSNSKNREKLHKDILDFLMEGILVTKNEKILYANERYKKYFQNRDNNNLLNNNVFDGINKENLKSIKQVMKSFDDPNCNNAKMVLENRDENNIDNLLEVSIKKVDNEGTFLSIVDVVTGRVKKLEAIRCGKKRYKQILSILPLGVLIHVDDRVIFANNSITRMLGYGNYKFIIGERVKKHIKYNFRNKFYSSLDNLIKETDSEPIEIEMVDVNGEILIVKAISSAIPFEKKAVLTIIKDITEERRREEKKLVLEETITYEKVKAEFLANISHDIKTPINVIYSSLQIIDSSMKAGIIQDETKKITKYIEIMKQNCYRGLKIANNLIDLSRYEMNAFELNLEKVNIVSIVEDIVTEVAKISAKKNISLIFDTEDEEITCYIDRIKIERVILNLLSNSIKFTRNDGEVLVFITTKKDSVIITVKDNGIGIPKNKINYIFDRFKQIDKSFTRNTEGSGLGLSIVKAIINLHGGRIKVDSEEGLGTEVSVLIYKREESLMDIGTDRYFKDYNEMVNIEFSDIYL